jgi:uncharacterized peroxidase-related enzyme
MQDKKVVEKLKLNDLEAIPDEKTRTILEYAIKLTKNPNTIKQNDIEQLKDIGCSDREILDVCQIVSYFNFVNRMADGLGVELEVSFKK